MTMPVTLDDVVQRLDNIIVTSINDDTRYGYYAAFARRVARSVRRDVRSKAFDNGKRMETLVVTLMNAYFRAYDAHRAGTPVAKCWEAAFSVLEDPRKVVLQHLLASLNAQVNYDLAMSIAMTTSDREALSSLRQDYFRLFAIFERELAAIDIKLDALSPWFGVIDVFFGRSEEKLIRFSLKIAREGAWKFAELLVQQRFDVRLCIMQDALVAGLGYEIVHPRKFLHWMLRLVSGAEPKSPGDITKALAG